MADACDEEKKNILFCFLTRLPVKIKYQPNQITLKQITIIRNTSINTQIHKHIQSMKSKSRNTSKVEKQ